MDANLASPNEPGPRTLIRLCGPLRVQVDGRDLAEELPGGQAAELLAYLVASGGRGVRRDELVAVLWPHTPPKDAGAALRPVLSRLRRALAPVALEGRERLRLELPEPVWIDVEQATESLEAARAAAAERDWNRAREQSAAALELLRPGFLPGRDGEWVEGRRRELEEAELEALELMAGSGIELGGTALVASETASRQVIARSPFRESGYRLLMEALARAGNAAEALRVYEELRVLLRDELGTPPSPDVQAVHARLLGADEAPAAPSAVREPALIPLPPALAPDEPGAFVGRVRELDALRAAWRHARSGTRRVVLLAGEPGIGKTRLVGEFARGAHADGTVLYASCPEEAVLSYQPFVEALRHYARNDPDMGRLALGPGATELARLIPELGPAPDDSPSDPETRRYLMFDAVTSFLTEASGNSPLALVLDDLHWADRATVALLRHVARAPDEAPLLIVGTYREAEVGPDHPLTGLLDDLRRGRRSERVPLGGLGEHDVGALIESQAGNEAPADVVGTVHEHTEGNPFFVEEVTRHLIETGALVEREGRWLSATGVDGVGVPEGVKDVIGRRLARLSLSCRDALSHGAIVGRTFSFAVLHQMAGDDEEVLIAALEEALDAQLLVEADDPGGPAYAFTHALVRETLYGSLSGARRQRMHERAAAAIEAVEGTGDEQIPALAVHHRLAGSAGDAAKAIEYSLRAGARAAELSAVESAAAHWEGALAVMVRAGDRQAERAALSKALGDLMLFMGDLGRQIDYLEQALALYEELGDDERAAQVHSRLGMAHSLIDSIYAEHMDINRAFHHFDAAREVLGRGSARRSRGHLDVGVSTALTYGFQIDRGIEAGANAMEIAERLGDTPLWLSAAESYGWHTIISGRLREGFETIERAMEIAEREQHPFLIFMGTQIRGQHTWGLGAPDEAQAFFERVLEQPYVGKVAFRREMADGVGRCHASRGELADARRFLSDANPAWFTHALKPLLDLWDGNWDEVESLATRVRDTSRRNGNRWDEWAAYHLWGRARYLRGDLEGAGDLLDQALTIVVDGGSPYFELWVRPDLARVHAEQGRVDDAREHVDRCRAIVGSGEDWRGLAGRVALVDAIVTAREGDTDHVAGLFAEALETLDRYKLRGDQADALHQWGWALADAGAAKEASAKLDEARTAYRALGVGDAWLERL